VLHYEPPIGHIVRRTDGEFLCSPVDIERTDLHICRNTFVVLNLDRRSFSESDHMRLGCGEPDTGKQIYPQQQRDSILHVRKLTTTDAR
jgi:hypothetical protein